jgi:hypothetical protein
MAIILNHKLTVSTTELGVHLYTADYLDGFIRGSKNRTHEKNLEIH